MTVDDTGDRHGHPQYVAFVLILFGYLLQWPTVLTLLMFPVLLVKYGRLAVTEESEMRACFGAEFERYAARTPRFIPHVGCAQETALPLHHGKV